MKIILSPSKIQDRTQLLNKKQTITLNQDKTNHLFYILKGFSKRQLNALMKIKNGLLDETYEIYQNHHLDSSMKEAIYLYQGVAFEQINVEAYNHNQLYYLNERLVILSAMYGAVRPNTMIYPYRLDMKMKPEGINLYQYWQKDINNFFKDDDLIINLASNEFSKMLKTIKDKMITIDFKDEDKNGKFRFISYNAKKARGKMVHQLTLNLVKDIEGIKTLIIDDYCYNSSQSSNKHLVFIKNYQ